MGCTRDMTAGLNGVKKALERAQTSYRKLNGNRRKLKVVDEQFIIGALRGANQAAYELDILAERTTWRADKENL